MTESLFSQSGPIFSSEVTVQGVGIVSQGLFLTAKAQRAESKKILPCRRSKTLGQSTTHYIDGVNAV